MTGKSAIMLRLWVPRLYTLSLILWSSVSYASPPLVTLHNFTNFAGGTEGAYPSGLIQGNDGNLYGRASHGGASDDGTVFRITTSGNLSILHTFTGNDGANPSGLIHGSNSNLYGTTQSGGANSAGTVFRMTTSGALSTLYNFSQAFPTNPDGAYPNDVIQGGDGNLYGTTTYGGANGWGTVFKMTTSGALVTLYSFTRGSSGTNPSGLMQATDGNLYGTTIGDANGSGAVFQITTSGTFTTLYTFSARSGQNFTNADGASPSGLVQGKDGSLYGSTFQGGPNATGAVFKVTTTGVLTTLYSFSGVGGPNYTNADGANPSGLIQGEDGNFYGTAGYGGAQGAGTVFQVTVSGSLTTFYTFKGNGEANPDGLLQGKDGNFYGMTTTSGTNGFGTVFHVTFFGVLTTLHNFSVANDGGNPYASLIQGKDGNLYGTTEIGGAYGDGTAFKITPSGAATTLYSFGRSATDGGSPVANLIQGKDGALYGTTEAGGAYSDGTVFKITTSGVLTVLYSFGGHAADGSGPVAGLFQGRDSALYGTTQYGGANGTGTVFRITTSGTLTNLYSFAAFNNSPYASNSAGGWPFAGVIQGTDGNLYGTTNQGGPYGYGTVFKITTSGTLTTLFSFSRDANGAWPYAGLIQGKDGVLYGTTAAGGTSGDNGTVFRITTSGALTTLHSFDNVDGGSPYSGLIQGKDGNLYGTARNWGGRNDAGTVFKISTFGIFTTLHIFNSVDGSNPVAGLIQGKDGNFYGTTAFGGAQDYGTVFKLMPHTNGFDANGDGSSDILFRNTLTGDLKLWEMNGLIILNQGFIAQAVPLQQQVVGAGDFTGDGIDDILWRDMTTGDVSLWNLNGFSILKKSTIYPALPFAWQVSGVGDFNGDGMADILWRDMQNGDVVLWEMNGPSILADDLVAAAIPSMWQVVGVGDFNGDGMADILWRNTITGDVYLWEMDGATIGDQGYVAQGLPLAWQVAGVGDFNGDGMDDILWHNTQTGDVVVWEMNGTSIMNPLLVASGVPPEWQVAGLGDFNDDGRSDVLWRNTATGDVYLWEMDGAAIINQGYSDQAWPLSWQIVAP